jgi:hypothetical protein
MTRQKCRPELLQRVEKLHDQTQRFTLDPISRDFSNTGARTTAELGLIRGSVPCRPTASLTRPATTWGSSSILRRTSSRRCRRALADGREAIVTTRVETGGVGPFAGLLEVAVATTPLTSDDAIA